MLGYSDMEVTDIKLKYIDLATNKDKDGNAVVTGKGYYSERLIPCDGGYFDKDKSVIELCNGKESEIYPQRIIQDSVGVQVQHVKGYDAEPVIRYSATNPMTMELEFGLDGLYKLNDNGNRDYNDVELKIEYKLGGKTSRVCTSVTQNLVSTGVTYSNTPNLNKDYLWRLTFDGLFHFLYPDTEVCKRVLKDIKCEKNPDKTFPHMENYVYKAVYDEYTYELTDWHSMYIAPRKVDELEITNDVEHGITKIHSKSNKTMRLVAKKEFTIDEIKGMLPNDSEEPNFIQVRVTRINEDSTDSKYNDKIYLVNVRTKCFDIEKTRKVLESGNYTDTTKPVPQYPIADKFTLNNTIVLALKIEASEGFNNSLEALNCICKSKAKAWNGTKWDNTESATSNPASLVYKMFTHPMLKTFAYDLKKKANLNKLGELYEFCKNAKYECNMCITSQIKLGDVIRKILEAGHSFLIPEENGYSFFIDKSRSEGGSITPELILNAHNMIAGGMSNTKDFEDIPDGLEISYVDEHANYKETSIKCFYDKSMVNNPSAKVENVKVDSITDAVQAWRYGKFNLLKRHLRLETWNRKVSFDAETINVGSYVEIQDDTLSVGLGEGGEILSVERNEDGVVTGFSVDSGLYIENIDVTYGVKFIHYDGSQNPVAYTYELDVNDYGYQTSFRFKNPVLDFPLAEGDVLSFGLYEQITTGAIVVGKTRNEDNTFDLTLIPYDEEIYHYDDPNVRDEDGFMPSFKPHMTDIESKYVPADDIPEVPVKMPQLVEAVTSVTSGSTTVIGKPDRPISLNAYATEKSVKVSWDFINYGLKNSVRCFVVELSTDSGKTFSRVGTTSSFSFEYDIESMHLESEAFATWRFRVYTLSIYSQTIYQDDDYASEYSEIVNVTANNYGTWLVSNPIITSRVSDRTISLVFNQENRADGKKVYGNIRYKIWVKRYDDESWFTPNLSNDPYLSEGNYKKKTTEPYILYGNIYTQCMPLKGQSNNKIVDTPYLFKVVAFNEVSESEVIETSMITAMCTSIRDIVKASEDFKQLYVSNLSAISADVGVVKSGSMTGDDYNYWALSKIPAEDGHREFSKGEFRVGDEDHYIEFVPAEKNSDGKSKMRINADLDVKAEISEVRGVFNVFPDRNSKEGDKPAISVRPDPSDITNSETRINGTLQVSDNCFSVHLQEMKES